MAEGRDFWGDVLNVLGLNNEAKAKAEALAKAEAEAEVQKAKAEAEAKAKAEAEAKAKAEAEAEAKAKAEAEVKRKRAEEEKARAEEEKARAEVEAQAREKAEAKAGAELWQKKYKFNNIIDFEKFRAGYEEFVKDQQIPLSEKQVRKLQIDYKNRGDEKTALSFFQENLSSLGAPNSSTLLGNNLATNKINFFYALKTYYDYFRGNDNSTTETRNFSRSRSLSEVSLTRKYQLLHRSTSYSTSSNFQKTQQVYRSAIPEDFKRFQQSDEYKQLNHSIVSIEQKIRNEKEKYIQDYDSYEKNYLPNQESRYETEKQAFDDYQKKSRLGKIKWKVVNKSFTSPQEPNDDYKLDHFYLVYEDFLKQSQNLNPNPNPNINQQEFLKNSYEKQPDGIRLKKELQCFKKELSQKKSSFLKYDIVQQTDKFFLEKINSGQLLDYQFGIMCESISDTYQSHSSSFYKTHAHPELTKVMLKFYRNLDDPENHQFKLDNDEKKLLELLYQKTQGKLTIDNLSRQSFSGTKSQYSNILLSANISDLRDSIAIAKEQFYMQKELYNKIDPETKIARTRTMPPKNLSEARAQERGEVLALKKSKSDSSLLEKCKSLLTKTASIGR